MPKLTKQTIEYVLAELQSRLEVLDDLMEYADASEAKQAKEWQEEYLQCEIAIEELSQ